MASPSSPASVAAAPMTSTSEVTSGSSSAGTTGGAECAGAFDPPVGAVLLCNEFVMLRDGTEAHWQSFGSRDAPSVVSSRYRELAAKCKLALTTDPAPVFSMVSGNRHLSTHAPSEPGLPGCGKTVDPAYLTVIVISAGG